MLLTSAFELCGGSSQTLRRCQDFVNDRVANEDVPDAAGRHLSMDSFANRVCEAEELDRLLGPDQSSGTN